jgi:hypothetical protein
MDTHKFRIGQEVSYRPKVLVSDAPLGMYVIIARLPQGDDGQFEYRIRHSSESHQRVAEEGELTASHST